jgi:hypothetical protein
MALIIKTSEELTEELKYLSYQEITLARTTYLK